MSKGVLSVVRGLVLGVVVAMSLSLVSPMGLADWQWWVAIVVINAAAHINREAP